MSVVNIKLTAEQLKRLDLVDPQLVYNLREYGDLNDKGVLTKAPDILVDRLQDWLRQDQQAEAAKALRAEARAGIKKFNDEMAAIASSGRQRLQRDRDQEAGFARLDQYVRESRLEPTEENAVLVQGFLDKNFGGYWSEGNVDHAIQQLQTRLRWRMI